MKEFTLRENCSLENNWMVNMVPKYVSSVVLWIVKRFHVEHVSKRLLQRQLEALFEDEPFMFYGA